MRCSFLNCANSGGLLGFLKRFGIRSLMHGPRVAMADAEQHLLALLMEARGGSWLWISKVWSWLKIGLEASESLDIG